MARTSLVTGSAGHLGEGLVRTLRDAGTAVRGIDILDGPWTDRVGSVSDRSFVRAAMEDVDVVYHTATLHKPHVATHAKEAFVETNVQGTLVLLEESVAAGVRAFVFTSTTSTFGDALRPPPEAPAVWITEDVVPVPKNIYGVTKTAAEDLCRLFHRDHGLPCVVLRTSRFFPEADDDRGKRQSFADGNLKTNEFLYRRVDVEDVVSAHTLASARAPDIGFGRYIISATTPFSRDDLAQLRRDPAGVVARVAPGYEDVYEARGWRLFEDIERVYDNAAARRDLGWRPKHDFDSVLQRLRGGGEVLSVLAQAIGAKGYHAATFEDGPYPV